jgi:Leucine-rich repeat (LRR) protein
MNSNAFKLSYGNISINDLTLPPGASKEVKLLLNNDNSLSELESFPYYIDCALKVLDDVYVFKVPCSLSVGMLPNATISVEEYKETVSDPQNNKKQDVLTNKLPLEEFVVKLKNNNMV